MILVLAIFYFLGAAIYWFFRVRVAQKSLLHEPWVIIGRHGFVKFYALGLIIAALWPVFLIWEIVDY